MRECYVDTMEHADYIIDADGKILSHEISGEIIAECKLPEKPSVYIKVRMNKDLDDLVMHPQVK